MLVHFQFPVSDLRRLSAEAGTVLPTPIWPQPQLGTSFLHSFGAVDRRPQGGLHGLIGEEMFCRTDNWIKLPRKATLAIADAGALPVRLVFSRLYFDGLVSGKYDLGFVIANSTLASVLKRVGAAGEVHNTRGAIKLLTQVPASLLALPSKFLKAGRVGPMRTIPEELRGALVRSTTRLAVRKSGELEPVRKWLKVGAPSVCLSSSGPLDGVLRSLNDSGRGRVSSWQDVHVGFHWRREGAVEMPVWLVSGRRGVGGGPQSRSLRIVLLRMTSDIYSLMHLLDALAADKLVISPLSASSDLLQRYLVDVCRRLRSDLKALPSEEAAAIALPIFTLHFRPGVVTDAMARLASLRPRPNVGRVVQATLDHLEASSRPPAGITLGPGAIYIGGDNSGPVETNVTMEG